MTAVRNDAHFDKMIYPADVAEAAMLVIRTSFNCCPTQIWLQNNPDIIHKVRCACRLHPLITGLHQHVLHTERPYRYVSGTLASI